MAVSIVIMKRMMIAVIRITRMNPVKNDKVTTRCIVFDLQKTMPIPRLQTNKIFYMRQLWTYNLGIHDNATGKATMFMWDETTASRGSQEISSCLLSYCRKLPDDVSHLTAYSDCCGGQNRN